MQSACGFVVVVVVGCFLQYVGLGLPELFTSVLLSFDVRDLFIVSPVSGSERFDHTVPDRCDSFIHPLIHSFVHAK